MNLWEQLIQILTPTAAVLEIRFQNTQVRRHTARGWHLLIALIVWPAHSILLSLAWYLHGSSLLVGGRVKSLLEPVQCGMITIQTSNGVSNMVWSVR